MRKAWIALVAMAMVGLWQMQVSAANGKTALEQGIYQYHQENYEESIELLQKARKQHPESTLAAFFLGMAYKQTLNYKNALPHLLFSVVQKPRIKEALVELIFVLHRLEKLDPALKWIEVAEKEKIYPAKVAFLKGMVLRDKGRTQEAIASYENARRIDPALSQSVDYEIGLTYLKAKDLSAARERFQQAVLQDPTSDLAGFARQYRDAVEKRMELEKPFRITLGVFGQYDSNVVSKPAGSDVAVDITDEDSFGLMSSLRLDYLPNFDGAWLFSAGYGITSNLHQDHSTTHDTLTNYVNVSPGYNFGKFTINLAAQYMHTLLRSPSYRRYMDQLSVGPLVRTLLGENHVLEFYTGYQQKNFFQPPLSPEEDRDATGFNTYLSWIWIPPSGIFFNLKYEFMDENTDGDNWDNSGFRVSVNTSIPLVDPLRLQLSGEMFMQDYDHVHTLGQVREDETYTISAGLAYEILKNTQIIAQYTRTRADSNLAVYDYDRDLYSAGIEIRF